MKKLILFLFLLPMLSLGQDSQYVNPMIGTGGHGHTFPGATVPFGMVQLSPDTRIDGSWDGCSGYHYSDAVIYGFSHTHLNGTGVSDFGDIMLMPTMGEPTLENKEYSSVFSHANEKSSAGFYSVKLDKYDIDVSLTASPRVGFHQYIFNKSGRANIVLDLNHRDKLLMGEVRVIDSKTIEVMRRSEAWASNQYVYAHIEFSRPMTITKVNNNAFAPAKTTDTFFAGSLLAIAFSADVKAGENIKIKVALSPTGYEGAKLNSGEIPGWDFNKVKADAQKVWDNELSKIQITEPDKDKRTIFYTALYHTMIQPNIAQDIDGKYRGRDNQIHTAKGFDYYSVFSLWDTFRAAHPLYTVIDKKRTADFINTFLEQYEQGGRLPVWELASNETDCMIGYHSVSVMADAMAKGIKGFDYEEAFQAAKHSAMLDHLGLDAYKRNGFIAIDDEHESVSKTLEYAYDDWCIAQMALILNHVQDYWYFMERSQSWKNVFDPETKHMRPRKNGGWDKPFDPREVNNNFTEGNSWQYSFFVPQDISGMIEAYGGNEKFEAKLDEMFSAPTETTGREQADITGLIGQYAHGNEPSHHISYLYTFVGKSEKAQEKVDYVLNNFYKNAPDGLIGNEDCGQMSAWYVLSSMGMYAVTPGIPKWMTIKPQFPAFKIRFDDGSSQTITANDDRTKLGIGNAAVGDAMPAHVFTPSAVISANQKSFEDKMKVEIGTVNLKEPKNNYIVYSVTDKKTKTPEWQVYHQPFEITETSKVQAAVKDSRSKEWQSKIVAAEYFKKPNNYTIDIKSVYNKQYHAGGPEGLIDGIFGSANWRKGDWQGYQSQDFEAVVDMKENRKISKLSANFLQDTRSWILMPTKVEFYVSTDGKNFTLAAEVNNVIDPKDYETRIAAFEKTIPPTKARYVKVKAYNYGKLPDWHQGSGGDAFIFIDEITIN
ncbi:MAG: alpha-mannosidase [Flavobacterium sp.]|nr:MAG: alpha-mannosidase [Flavobacterium sp.]